MQRRKFSREVKVEAVRLIKEREVSAAQAAREIDVQENVLRKWVRDEEIGAKVRASFIGSARTYGARRVWRDMLAEGIDCGLHRIERLMRAQARRARPRRRGLPKDDGQRSTIAPNTLDREFSADRPDQRWIADFAYVCPAEGWLYVAAVIDLFSRRVVVWSMKAELTAQLVTDALVMAIWRRGKPDAFLHHSDQGNQYASEQFRRLMADNGVACSMSRAGNVWDNAAMESFFSSLKTERTRGKVYRTRNEARADVFDYIERFYNAVRRHSTIGYVSPMEFEQKVRLAKLRVHSTGSRPVAGHSGKAITARVYHRNDTVESHRRVMKIIAGTSSGTRDRAE